MLVLSMNSKRQRRPNVRLGEIGDVSAAFACGVSQKATEKLGHKRWKHDFVNPKEIENNPICGFSKQRSSEFTASEPGGSPRISADLQQNRENNNPNSSRMAFEFASSDEFDMTKSKLDFSNITRKCRVMKRRGRSNNNVFGRVWSFKVSSELSSEDGKECGGNDFIGFTSNVCDDYYPDNGFKDFSDRETPAMSKEACEYDIYEPNFDARKQGNLNDFWKEDACYEGNYASPKSGGVLNDFWKEDACYEGNNASPKSGGVWNEMGFGGSDVNSVRGWLEELGFGKYAGVFEKHEVDEEALPLLTLEDLKEMGVFAVGPRRKLYAAIQQLRGDHVSA